MATAVQIVERKKGYTIWSQLDHMGRKRYETTRDRDGAAVEPVDCRYETIKTAMRVFWEDERNDELWGG